MRPQNLTEDMYDGELTHDDFLLIDFSYSRAATATVAASMDKNLVVNEHGG